MTDSAATAVNSIAFWNVPINATSTSLTMLLDGFVFKSWISRYFGLEMSVSYTRTLIEFLDPNFFDDTHWQVSSDLLR